MTVLARPPRFVVAAVRQIFGKGRNQRADERAVEDAEQDRRHDRGGQERVHLPLRAVVFRAYDLAREAQQRRPERRRHDKKRRACQRDAIRFERGDDLKTGLNARRPCESRPESSSG